MAQRIELHNELCSIMKELGYSEKHVYFQPPESIKLGYPCIIYEREDVEIKHADNRSYSLLTRYNVTTIDRNPDSILYRKVLSRFPNVRYDRHFTSDNLHHDSMQVYY